MTFKEGLEVSQPGMADMALALGQVDLIGMEAGVRPPGKPDKAAQESAHAAAETMQVQQKDPASPLSSPHPHAQFMPMSATGWPFLPSYTSCLGLHRLGDTSVGIDMEGIPEVSPSLTCRAWGQAVCSSRAGHCLHDKGGVCRPRRRQPQRATTWWTWRRSA